jgi:ubiquinone/menaquinone biosynthesis C-methylase UbiE
VRSSEAERHRLERRYAEYAGDAGKQMAWSAINPGNAAIRAEIAARIVKDLPAAPRVLDIGCGGGWWLGLLQMRGVPPNRLHGVDLIAARVTQAGECIPGADIRVADARQLPYADGSFDVVLLLTTLSSMADRSAIRSALTEARRVLAPGGRLIAWDVRVPNPRNHATVRPRRADYRAALGPAVRFERVTLAPPIARRLGRLAPHAYAPLARVGPFTTHWLVTLDQSPNCG